MSLKNRLNRLEEIKGKTAAFPVSLVLPPSLSREQWLYFHQIGPRPETMPDRATQDWLEKHGLWR